MAWESIGRLQTLRLKLTSLSSWMKLYYFVSFTYGFVKGIYFDRITLGRKPKMTTCFSSYLMDVNRKLVETATAEKLPLNLVRSRLGRVSADLFGLHFICF